MCLYGDDLTRDALVKADVITALVECTKPSAWVTAELMQVSVDHGRAHAGASGRVSCIP